MAVIAHLGHDLVSLAFFVPTVAFLVWLGVSQLRVRWAERERRAAEETAGRSLP